MADKNAWKDLRLMEELFMNTQKCLDDFKKFVQKLEKFKLAVMDNPANLAELKKLLDEHPNWKLPNVQAKYNEFKAIYDYLEA